MNGMVYQYQLLYTFDSDDYTVTNHWELAPTPTIAQVTLNTYDEGDDRAHTFGGIKYVEYLDSDGVTRHADYDDPPVVSVNGMTRVDWELTVSSCLAEYVINLFFWNAVY